MNKYYKTNDGWFDFYVNAETGEKKAKLDKDDILVEKPEVDDFVSGYNIVKLIYIVRGET